MNIGIDIDNTLTEIQEELNKAAYDYAIKLGKNINNAENQLEDIKIMEMLIKRNLNLHTMN